MSGNLPASLSPEYYEEGAVNYKGSNDDKDFKVKVTTSTPGKSGATTQVPPVLVQNAMPNVVMRVRNPSTVQGAHKVQTLSPQPESATQVTPLADQTPPPAQEVQQAQQTQNHSVPLQNPSAPVGPTSATPPAGSASVTPLAGPVSSPLFIFNDPVYAQNLETCFDDYRSQGASFMLVTWVWNDGRKKYCPFHVKVMPNEDINEKIKPFLGNNPLEKTYDDLKKMREWRVRGQERILLHVFSLQEPFQTQTANIQREAQQRESQQRESQRPAESQARTDLIKDLKELQKIEEDISHTVLTRNFDADYTSYRQVILSMFEHLPPKSSPQYPQLKQMVDEMWSFYFSPSATLEERIERGHPMVTARCFEMRKCVNLLPLSAIDHQFKMSLNNLDVIIQSSLNDEVIQIELIIMQGLIKSNQLSPELCTPELCTVIQSLYDFYQKNKVDMTNFGRLMNGIQNLKKLIDN